MTTILSVLEATEELQKNNTQDVYRLCNAGRIRGAYKEGGKWHIPSPVEVLPAPAMAVEPPPGYLSLADAAKQVKCSYVNFYRLCSKGRVQGAYQVQVYPGPDGNRYFIPDPVVILPPPTRLPHDDEYSVAQVVEAIGIRKAQVQRLCQRGEIEGSVKRHGYWCIPKRSVEALRASLEPSGILTASQAAVKMGVRRQRVHQLYKAGRIVGAYQDEEGRLWIPEPIEVTERRRRSSVSQPATS